MAHTIKEVQQRLMKLGYDVGPSRDDGIAGTDTDKAVAKFQSDMKAKGLRLEATGALDPDTLDALFPGAPITDKPKTIQATAFDFFLNFIKSKTVYAAGALVVLIAGWVNTRFGINVPPEVQNTVTQLLVYAGAALIGILQTWFSSPHVSTKQPAVVQQPAETK